MVLRSSIWWLVSYKYIVGIWIMLGSPSLLGVNGSVLQDITNEIQKINTLRKPNFRRVHLVSLEKFIQLTISWLKVLEWISGGGGSKRTRRSINTGNWRLMFHSRASWSVYIQRLMGFWFVQFCGMRRCLLLCSMVDQMRAFSHKDSLVLLSYGISFIF